jgi:hypothetical protein
MVVSLEGRPLKRDEERRITAQTTERQPGSHSLDAAPHYTILNLPIEQFTVMLLLGMLCGVSAVFIALFML